MLCEFLPRRSGLTRTSGLMESTRSEFDVKVLRQRLQRQKENHQRRQKVKTKDEDVPKETKEEQATDEDVAKEKKKRRDVTKRNQKTNRSCPPEENS